MRRFFTSWILGLAVCALLIPFATQAAEEIMQEAPADAPPMTTEVTVIADINVTDVNVVEKDGVITGTVALQGKMGQQNDIVYGIIVTSNDGRLLAVSPLGEASVKQDEVTALSIRYTLPTTLSGPVKVFLQAETRGGVALGAQKLWEGTRGTTATPNPLSCTVDQAKLSCTHKTGGTVTASFFQGSFFGTPVKEETYTLKSGVALVMAPDLPANRYTVLVQGDDGALGLTTLAMPGTYGTIQNIALFQNEQGGLSGVVTVQVLPSTGSSVAVTVSTDGKDCDTKSAPIVGRTASFDFNPICTRGMVTVTLLGKDGMTLDTVTQSFDTVSITERATPQMNAVSETFPSSSERFLLFVILAVGVVLLVTLFVSVRKKGIVGVFLFTLVSLGGFSLVPQTHAMTSSMYIFRGGGEPVEAFYSTVTVTSDKASYAPGETMTLTGQLTVTEEYGAYSGDKMKSSLAWYGIPGGPVWDTALPAYPGAIPVLVSSPVDPIDVGSDMFYFTTDSRIFSLPGAMTAGNHFLAMRFVTTAYDRFDAPYTFPDVGFKERRPSFNFTVVGASAPVLTFTASSTNLPVGGGQSTLTWSTTPNAVSCVADTWNMSDDTVTGGAITAPSGSDVRNIAATRTFELECWDGAGVSSGIKTVKVTVASAPPVSCTWQDAGYTNGFYEVQNNARMEDVCDTSKPTWFLSTVCPGAVAAGGDSSAYANGYKCYDAGTKFKGFSPTYETGMCLAKAYTSTCTGSAPIATISAFKKVAVAPTWWDKAWALLTGNTLAHAAGPDVNMDASDIAKVTWSSSDATGGCTERIDGVQFDTTRSGTRDFSNLSVGTHVFSITCFNASGSNTDTVNVVVAAALPSATISANPLSCVINANQSTCLVGFTWDIQNATTPNLYNTTRGVQYTTNVTGTNISYPITFGANTIETRDGGVVLANVAVTGTCANGTAWVGANCAPVCVPSNDCSDAVNQATADGICIGQTFTINDGCGTNVDCGGTRSCDYNWKEVAP